MKIHFLSRGYAVPLAYHSQMLGCQSTVFLPNNPCNGDFVRLQSPRPPYTPDTVVVDGIGWGPQIEKLEEKGWRVVFGGKWAELMAGDVGFHEKVMAKVGMEPPPEWPPAPLLEVYGAWWEGDSFREPYYTGTLRIRMMVGDLGPAVSPPMGCELQPTQDISMLDPLIEVLREAKYRGLVSLLKRPDGPVAGIAVGIQSQIVEAVSEMVFGGFPALISVEGATTSGDCAVSLALSIPPWPYAHGRPTEPIRFSIPDTKHFWPLDVKISHGQYEYCGSIGVIGTVTARGRPETAESSGRTWFKEAGYRSLRTAERFDIPLVQYRTDLGTHH